MTVFHAVAATLLLLLLVPGSARSAEVVWLDPPTPQDALRVAVQAGATRGPLSPAAFRAIPVSVDLADDRDLDALSATLEQVRVHEKVLDGELLILNGLEGPLRQVRLLRDRDDRQTVVRALLYQGFAADRYWGDTLRDAPDAAPWRLTIDDVVVERPWLDAFALDPLRKARDEDITEAPQREAYDQLRRTLARATRATIVAADLPPGAELVLDGEVQQVDEDPTLEVLPGRHWMHVVLDGHIIGRHTVRLEPAQRFEVTLPVPESDWQDLVRALHTLEAVWPDSVLDVVRDLGGEVWFAEGQGATLRVWAVTPLVVRRVDLLDTGSSESSAEALGDVSLAGWAGASWLMSADFQEQSSEAGMHAFAPLAGAELAWDRDWLRYGLGVDVSVPVGAQQVARSGAEARYRLRPTPHVLIGHPLIQARVGWLAPFHLSGGVQATVPLPVEGLEIRGLARVAGTPPRTRADGSTWRGRPIVQVGVGLGGRPRP